MDKYRKWIIEKKWYRADKSHFLPDESIVDVQHRTNHLHPVGSKGLGRWAAQRHPIEPIFGSTARAEASCCIGSAAQLQQGAVHLNQGTLIGGLIAAGSFKSLPVAIEIMHQQYAPASAIQKHPASGLLQVQIRRKG